MNKTKFTDEQIVMAMHIPFAGLRRILEELGIFSAARGSFEATREEA